MNILQLLQAYLEAEATPTESTFGMPGPGEQNITYNSLANIELISSISRSISDWNEQDTDKDHTILMNLK